MKIFYVFLMKNLDMSVSGTINLNSTTSGLCNTCYLFAGGVWRRLVYLKMLMTKAIYYV